MPATASRRGAAAHESPADVEHVADADERSSADARDLAATLARLPPTQRHALVLREWRGLAYREIAAELDLSEPAVETLLFRARRRVAELLAQRRRVLDVGSAVSALRSLLGPTAAKVGAAAAVGCVGAAVTVPLAVTRDHPATPRPARTAPDAAPSEVSARRQVAPVDRPQAAPTRPRTRRDRSRAASQPPRAPVERPAAAPASVPTAGTSAADDGHLPRRQPPAAPAPSGAGTEPKAPPARPAPPAATTTTPPAPAPIDTVAGTAPDAVDTVTAAGESAVGTVTTAVTGAVETATETAGSAAGTVTESASGAVAGATGAVADAAEAAGAATPSVPLP